jgi:hypothetical protein
LERAAMILAGAGIGAHILVGIMDEHRIVLHPVGHLTLILLQIWALTATVGGLSLLRARGRAPFALGAVVVAGIGTLLLFTV